MNCEIATALIGVVSGLVGLVAGNRLAWGRDDRNSRSQFRGSISQLKAQVSGVDNWGFQDWYKSMQIEVEKQCAIVESAIGCRCRSRFAAARQECAKAQTQHDLMDDRAPFVGLPMGLDRLPEVTYQRGRKRASTILESLLDVCK